MKTNVSSANYWAVANGAGIGVFPTYAAALGGRSSRWRSGCDRPFDIWLSYHPGSGRIPRVRQHDRLAGGGFQSRKIPVV